MRRCASRGRREGTAVGRRTHKNAGGSGEDPREAGRRKITGLLYCRPKGVTEKLAAKAAAPNARKRGRRDPAQGARPAGGGRERQRRIGTQKGGTKFRRAVIRCCALRAPPSRHLDDGTHLDLQGAGGMVHARIRPPKISTPLRTPPKASGGERRGGGRRSGRA